MKKCFIFINNRLRKQLFLYPDQSPPAVNDRFFSYLTRFICAVLRPVFVVPYTVSNCRKRPETTVHVTFFNGYGGRNHCPGYQSQE